MLLNIGSSIAKRKSDFEFLNADALFTDTASEPFVWAALPVRPQPRKRRRKRGKRAASFSDSDAVPFDLLFQPFCWLSFSHWITNSANCGRASHSTEKQRNLDICNGWVKCVLYFRFLGPFPSAMALLFLDILNWIFSSGLGIRDKSPPTLTIDWLTYRNRPIRMLSVLHALHEAHTQTSTCTHTQGPSLPLPFCRARATCVEAQSLSRMRALDHSL